MTMYSVSVECLFDADTPEDAVRQAVAWLSENAHTAGYRVDSAEYPGSLDCFIDAERLPLDEVSE